MSLIISNMLKSQLSKILWITVGWTFLSVYYVLIVYAGLIDLDDAIVLDLWLYIKGSLMTGIFAGIIGGSVLVFFWEKWLRTKTYGSSLWSMLWTYIVIDFIVEIPGGLFIGSSDADIANLKRENPFFSFRMKVLSQ